MNIKRFATLSVLFLLALTMNACTLSAPTTLVTQASEIPNTIGNRPQFIVEDNGLYIVENNEPRLLIDLTTLIIEASDPAVGPQGEVGPQGPQGDPGPQGEMGPQGPQGEAGPQGERGPAGSSGSSGSNGAPGLQGPKGDQGPQGLKGDQGVQGPEGPQGPKGDQGIQGIQGDQGPQGLQGEDGDSVQLLTSGQSVYWSYQSNPSWSLLFTLPASETTSGVTFTPEFQTTQTHVQWRPNSNSVWVNLFEVPTHTVITQTNETVTYEVNDLSDIVASVHPGILRVTHDDGFGSAVIYKKTGNTYFIVTNNHVIGEMTNLYVTVFKHGNEFDITENITLIGKDPSTDLAILSFESSLELPVIDFADSNEVVVGEIVFAIGNPASLGQLNGTVTDGIISATNRLYTGYGIVATYYLQHNAPINSGNSGGGLFNTQGQLIGINNVKPASTSVDGIALAVTSNIIKRVILDLEEYETTTSLTRAKLLIDSHPNPLTCEAESGVCISEVTDMGLISTAHTMGLQAGDLIVGYKHERMDAFIPVLNPRQFGELVLQTRYLELVQIQYIRDGVLTTTIETQMGQ